MKGFAARITPGLTLLSVVKVDDNSGAKEIRIINRLGYKGRRGRQPPISVGDVIIGSVIKGKKDMRKKIVRAVIIRQKKDYRRATGERIRFEDNAAVLITDKNEPKASEIKGVVAKEVAERFPKVATISKNVI
ncbi:MAG: uL14 family ribosomal protein [Candidatus Micrarchaeota archaeon]